MSDNRGILKKIKKKSLCAYVAIIVLSCAVFFSGLPWQQYVSDVLKYHGQISIVFTLIVLGLIPFRLYAFNRKKTGFLERKFRIFGPLVSYISEPIYDIALFYSALFMLYTVFQNVLSLDPLLVLLLVSVILLYESLNDVFRMAQDLFYAKSLQDIDI